MRKNVSQLLGMALGAVFLFLASSCDDAPAAECVGNTKIRMGWYISDDYETSGGKGFVTYANVSDSAILIARGDVPLGSEGSALAVTEQRYSLAKLRKTDDSIGGTKGYSFLSGVDMLSVVVRGSVIECRISGGDAMRFAYAGSWAVVSERAEANRKNPPRKPKEDAFSAGPRDSSAIAYVVR